MSADLPTDADLGVDADEFARIFRKALNEAPTEEARRWMLDVAKRAQTKADREYMWCQQLGDCCLRLTAEKEEPHWSIVEIFWPRAYGVMTELRDKHAHAVDLAREAGTIGTVPVIALRVMLKAIDSMRTAVSADETHAVALDYFRQRACHISQRKFALQWDRPKEKLAGEGRQNPINGKVYSVAEMDGLLEPIYRSASDEAFIAADIAEVLKPHANYLVYGLAMLRNPGDLRQIVELTREAQAEARRKRDAETL
jgi:hypothetical protein